MQYSEDILWIQGTPMGLNIRKLSYIVPHRHENLIEIILCLKGTVKISYLFEEFTLVPGEFILVDKDVHYLYGDDTVCVSFYIDLLYFKEKYPEIDSLLFICEAVSESTVPHDTYDHKYLKSIMLSLLLYIGDHADENNVFREKIRTASDKIINLLMDRFDIIFYYDPDLHISTKAMQRYRKAMKYINENDQGKISLKELAGHCDVSSSYMSEFLGSCTMGFRGAIGYMRAWKSEKYLLDTDMNVLEISEICGFSDPKYYYEAFKKWYQCTPGQFRKRYKEDMEKKSAEEQIEISEIAAHLTDMIEKHLIDMFL